MTDKPEDNLPVVADDDSDDSFPTEYWPKISETRGPGKYTDEVLLSIVTEIAQTNLSTEQILKNHEVSAQQYYRLRGRLPRFFEATEHAKNIRRERLNEEILEIADADFKAGADLDEAKFDLAHRKLKMDARKHLAKQAAPAKGMEKFSVNIGSKKDEDGENVTIVQVKYGDEK